MKHDSSHLVRNKFGQWEISSLEVSERQERNVIVNNGEIYNSSLCVFERFRYFIQTQDEFWQLGFVFTFTLTNCLYLLFRVYGGKCEKLSYGPYYCNPNENCESLPASNLIFLGFTPVLATMVLSRWRVIAVSLIWIMILITLSVVAAMEYQPWEIWTLVLVLLLPLLIIYDLRYKDYERYIATQQLREALNENKRLNE
jgi:hypothetical protein